MYVSLFEQEFLTVSDNLSLSIFCNLSLLYLLQYQYKKLSFTYLVLYFLGFFNLFDFLKLSYLVFRKYYILIIHTYSNVFTIYIHEQAQWQKCCIKVHGFFHQHFSMIMYSYTGNILLSTSFRIYWSLCRHILP